VYLQLLLESFFLHVLSPTVVCMAIYDMGNMSLQAGREAARLVLATFSSFFFLLLHLPISYVINAIK